MISRGLSYSDAIVGTIMALYLTTQVTLYRRAVGAGRRHPAGLADMYMLHGTARPLNNSGDARAINCVDRPRLPIATALSTKTAAPETYRPCATEVHQDRWAPARSGRYPQSAPCRLGAPGPADGGGIHHP